MKPNADEEDVLTGDDAISHMVDRWNDIGAGMVQVEFHDPWLIVTRSGGTYTTFISVVDDTAVTILENDATTRHIPKELRPDEKAPGETMDKIRRAFGQTGAGSYPLTGEEAFAIGFRTDDGFYELQISWTDDSVEIDG